MSDFGLGRIRDFDPRSRAYPIVPLLTHLYGDPLPPRSYTWACPVYLNQGSEGSCVGHAWAHEIAAKPVPWPSTSYLARLIYKQAQVIDPWPGEAYEGTSVLAGVKIAQQLGHYKEYRWAFGLDDLVLALGYKGPAVLGIPWTEDMFDPDASGLLHPTGTVAGGHAILATGVSVTTKRVRLHNSWGTGWGLNGDAFIGFADLDSLLHQQGEACIPLR